MSHEKRGKATTEIDTYFDGAGTQLCYISTISETKHRCPMLLWIEDPPYCQFCKTKLEFKTIKLKEKVYAVPECPLSSK